MHTGPAPDSVTPHVHQVAPFSSPDSFARWRRVAHVTGPPGGVAQLTDLSARWRRSAHRLVHQVAPLSSPTCPPGCAVQLTDLSARWRRSAHPTCPPGGAVQTTQVFRQVASCKPHHSRVVTTPDRTPGNDMVRDVTRGDVDESG